MSKKYDDYLTEHKKNVFQGLEWFETNLPCYIHHDWRETFDHDWSKTLPDEYEAYDAYFYGNNRSYSVVNNFKQAWLRHIHRNQHHWQHWVLINDEPNEGMVGLEMPLMFIVEMICDWWSFSWAKGDLMEIFKWYEDHKKYMVLGDETRHTVENILKEMLEKLNKGDDTNAEKNL